MSETPSESDALETARALQGALEGMSTDLKNLGERLEGAEKRQRLSRRLIITLAVSLIVDVTLTVLVTVATLQAHTAVGRANATVADLHASQVAACQIGNQTFAREVALWEHIASLSLTATTPPEIRRQDEQLLAYIRSVFAPRDCAKIYRLP